MLPDGKFGVVKPKVGNPNDMRLEYLDKNTKVEKGDLVITSGSTDKKLESLFPKGIPIGRVKRVDPDELDIYERIHIEPFADFKRMEFVQVLRANPQPDPDTEQAPNGSSGRGHAVTLTPGTFIRVGLLLLLAMVLQVSTFSQLDVLGGNADITVLAVAAVALYSGSVPGAIAGFCAGLLLDLALGANLGATSLVLTVVGYFVGRFMELRDPAHGLIPLPVALVGQRRLRHRCGRRAVHA